MSQTFISPSLSFTSHLYGKLTSIVSHRSSINCDSNRGIEIKKRRPLHAIVRIRAMGDQAEISKMNLNEYMVSLERPLGIRFALSVDGRVFVHSMKRGGNAEKSRIIMVGDAVKKANDSSTDGFINIKNLNDIEKIIKKGNGTCNLVLERPATPYPIHELPLNEIPNILFNKGRVGLSTWNSKSLSNPSSSNPGSANPGFAIFSPKLLSSDGWALLSGKNNSKIKSEIIGTVCEDEGEENVEWAFGGFPLEEYIKALDRAKGELYYNHSRGMQFSKITEQIYVGSCIQTEKDVEKLSNDLGITAVLNFQSERERINWGINSKAINSSCENNNILMINYPIREVDSTDLRKKLPFCVGLLLRLLRKNYKIYVTCTTGFDRAPTCVIAYLHWIQDTSLNLAFNFVTGPHCCRPNRGAIVWATWDLIALAENGKREGPPTHSVNFVWNNGREGEEVFLVGDFTNDWKDTIKAVHKGGPRYEAEIRLRHGKYFYKFIVGGQWKHSTSLPTETDERGNVNNVIRVGDIAQIRPNPNYLRINDPTVVKVIERVLTEDERFFLAFAARRMAFAICPLKFSPKQ